MISLSKTMSGLVILTIICGGIFIFLADGILQYAPDVPSNYNSSFTKIESKLTELSQIANDTQESLNINADANNNNPFTDFLGFIFNSGYQAASVAKTGVSLAFDVASLSLDEILGGTQIGGLLKVAAGTLIIIFITISILLAFVIKSGRE